MTQICFKALGVVLLAATLAAAEPADAARKVVTVRADSSSGRLVRTVVVTPKVIQPVVVKKVVKEEPAPAVGNTNLAADSSINDIVDAAARKHNVDPLLVHSVIQVESGYNKYAVSHAGAQGLMQLIPSTARRLGVKNVFDPRENIEAGVKYLKQLQTMFRDDRLALAAYNAGENAVARYGTIPPYAETLNYVVQVGTRLGVARRTVAAQQKPVTKPGEAKPKKIEQFVDTNGTLHLRMQQ
ncbi:MAG: lytic transglycosylase domain-containing protein [Acidobacteria bacterium]|nr:lytic transglycosylase domain-containing protein [Acidobacteriota bacterium]